MKDKHSPLQSVLTWQLTHNPPSAQSEGQEQPQLPVTPVASPPFAHAIAFTAVLSPTTQRSAVHVAPALVVV